MSENKQREPDAASYLLLAAIIFITGIHWLVLALGIPVLDALPYWKFDLRLTQVSPSWIALAFIAFGLAVTLTFSKANYTLKLAAIIVLGATIQFSLAYSKGQGLDGLRSRIETSGHAEFARVAVTQPSMRAVAKNYESLLSDQAYDYLPSKPPGTLLFYILTDRVAQIFLPPSNQKTQLENLRTFASITWPIVSYFAVIPLFFLARELSGDPDVGMTASVTYISIPSLNLITLHTDQTIYPFLAIVPVLMAVMARRRNSLWLAFLSGVAFYLTVYFSFGLAVVGLLLLLPVFVSIPEPFVKPITNSLRCAGAIALGVAAANAFAYFSSNYDLVARYSGAIHHHLLWKGWQINVETYLWAGYTDIVEFFVWIGFPMTILFLVCLVGSFHKLILHKPDISAFYNILIAVTFLFMLAFGKTKAETARLWLFLVPFICLSAANFLSEQPWSKRGRLVFAITILLLEMGTTYFTLHFQDFN